MGSTYSSSSTFSAARTRVPSDAVACCTVPNGTANSAAATSRTTHRRWAARTGTIYHAPVVVRIGTGRMPGPAYRNYIPQNAAVQMAVSGPLPLEIPTTAVKLLLGGPASLRAPAESPAAQ